MEQAWQVIEDGGKYYLVQDDDKVELTKDMAEQLNNL